METEIVDNEYNKINRILEYINKTQLEESSDDMKKYKSKCRQIIIKRNIILKKQIKKISITKKYLEKQFLEILTGENYLENKQYILNKIKNNINELDKLICNLESKIKVFGDSK